MGEQTACLHILNVSLGCLFHVNEQKGIFGQKIYQAYHFPLKAVFEQIMQAGQSLVVTHGLKKVLGELFFHHLVL